MDKALYEDSVVLKIEQVFEDMNVDVILQARVKKGKEKRVKYNLRDS